MSCQQSRALGEGFCITKGVPDVGVLGHQTQGLLRAASTDHDRDIAGRCRIQLRPAALDPRECLSKIRNPGSRGPELIAVLHIVALEPARTDAEDEAPVRDVIDRAGHIGE